MRNKLIILNLISTTPVRKILKVKVCQKRYEELEDIANKSNKFEVQYLDAPIIAKSHQQRQTPKKLILEFFKELWNDKPIETES